MQITQVLKGGRAGRPTETWEEVALELDLKKSWHFSKRSLGEGVQTEGMAA